MATKDPNAVDDTPADAGTSKAAKPETAEATEAGVKTNKDGLPIGTQLSQAEILANNRKHKETHDAIFKASRDNTRRRRAHRRI